MKPMHIPKKEETLYSTRISTRFFTDFKNVLSYVGGSVKCHGDFGDFGSNVIVSFGISIFALGDIFHLTYWIEFDFRDSFFSSADVE